MKKVYIFLIIFLPIILTGQENFVEEFEGNTIPVGWNFPHDTYAGSVADGVMKIDYNRTADSWIWDQFNFQLPAAITVSENPILNIRVRTDEKVTLVLKPENTAGGSDWLEKTIQGDGEWNEIFYELTNSSVLPIQNLYIYFDPASSSEKSAMVEIDKIVIGSDMAIPLDSDLLQQAVIDATNLLQSSVVGVGQGHDVQEDLDSLTTAIDYYEGILLNLDDIESQEVLDSLAIELYDVCIEMEQNTFSNTDRSAVDSMMVYSSKILLENLHKLKGPRFMYGMHDPTGYGVGWNGNDDRSDVKDVTGSYPAFFSWDANSLIRAQSSNRVEYRVESSHDLGVVTSFCWHQYDPQGISFYSDEVPNNTEIGKSLLPGNANNELYKSKLATVAKAAKSMRGEDGRSIPIIFRPYHEHNGWWFWWGSNMPEQDYIDLWQYTVEYLRDTLGVHNLIYAFSPDGSQINGLKPYTFRYPGDDYVDLLGLDFYFDNGTDLEVSRFLGHLESVVSLADSLDKVAAVTEIGDRNNLSIDRWHTKSVLNPIKNSPNASKIAYVATWRNQDESHHFAPYPGHDSELDFYKFYSDTTTIFLNNMVKGITDSLYTTKLNEKSDAAFLLSYKLKNGPQFTIDGLTAKYGGPLTFNYTNATAQFDYSQLGNIDIDGEAQVSDSSKVNLSLPTFYTVVSENGEVERSYEIILEQIITSSIDIAAESGVELDIYPLPAREYVNIDCSETMKQIQLFSADGRVLKTLDNISSKNLQLNGLEKGMVILKIRLMNGKSLTRKITIN